MSNRQINEKILKQIRTIDDRIISDFLITLIYDESEHSEKWWWKDSYKKRIEEESEKWDDNNEN